MRALCLSQVTWRKLNPHTAQLAEAPSPTPRQPRTAPAPARAGPALSERLSVTLGGGSVSTVRAGVLVGAAVAACGSGGAEPVASEQAVALKLFKTAQAMHSRGHLEESSKFSLYPEVRASRAAPERDK